MLIISNICLETKNSWLGRLDTPADNINTSTHFKCSKCKELVSIDDKFNDDLQEDQMCKHMVHESKGLVQPRGLHCIGAVEIRRFTTHSTECLGPFI